MPYSRSVSVDSAAAECASGYEVVNPQGRAPALLVCDHASAHIPARYRGLGVRPEHLRTHIAWDIGASDVADRLARLLDAPLVRARFSRLLIDPNRILAHDSSIVTTSEGIAVPGNQGLDAGERERRVRAFFRPYHDAIARQLDRFEDAGVVPTVISVHTFTPVYAGVARRWHVGILWNRNVEISRQLIEHLRAEPSLLVGDNEPYDARVPIGYTIPTHAEARGTPHALLEIRHDLVAEGAGAQAWAMRLARVLRRTFPALRTKEDSA